LNRSLTYVDRRDGSLKTDPIYAAGFLDWCYNSQPGMLVTRMLLSRRLVSAVYGWYYKQRWTRGKVSGFAAAMKVDVDELLQPLSSFGSFSEFISRPIDLSRRRIDPDPQTCISPADGRLLAYPVVHASTPLRIKSSILDLRGLLAADELTDRYDGGSVVILRLYLADYHRFHFPDSGTPGPPRAVPGRYFAVTPYARRWAVPFYAENHRVVTLLDSDAFGRIAIVEVGAFTVGSVRQTFVPEVRVARGEHKGYFELGASIVVLVFEPAAIRLDDDLCENSHAGLETFVRVGERIGRKGG
jgi:phosphatidylserine decarboxylase